MESCGDCRLRKTVGNRCCGLYCPRWGPQKRLGPLFLRRVSTKGCTVVSQRVATFTPPWSRLLNLQATRCFRSLRLLTVCPDPQTRKKRARALLTSPATHWASRQKKKKSNIVQRVCRRAASRYGKHVGLVYLAAFPFKKRRVRRGMDSICAALGGHVVGSFSNALFFVGFRSSPTTLACVF